MLAFFKVSCPTCQYAFPFLERLHKAYGENGVSLFGISQNNAKDTAAFNKEFGITFPTLLDDTDSYPVSNAYGLTNVPTIFWIAQDGEIEVSSVGWVKADFEEIGRKMADVAQDHARRGVQAGRRCARLPRWLRFQELAAGRRTQAHESNEHSGRGRPGLHSSFGSMLVEGGRLRPPLRTAQLRHGRATCTPASPPARQFRK